MICFFVRSVYITENNSTTRCVLNFFFFLDEYGFTNTKPREKGHDYALRKEPLLVVAREAQM